MRRLLFICMALFIGALPLTINTMLAQAPSVTGSTASAAQDNSSVRSWPPDTNTYVRKVIPEDYGVSKKPESPSAIFVRDVVVSNTDPNLTNTDTLNDGEPTIAVNPANTNEIVLTAFSGSSGGNAALWHSTDGGNTWTKRFTVPSAPGVGGFLGCVASSPCDQAVDYGRNNQMSGTFLDSGKDIHSGTTTNPANSASWNWLVIGGVTQRTNSAGVGNSDQPWLLVDRDPVVPGQDNVYVAYDNFNGSPDMRVAVALGTNPPNFVRDNLSGFSTGFVNPGHRLAVDPNNGAVYSLFQRRIATGADGISQNINFMLNRSTDGGLTWGLNGNPTGIVVANADSTQPQPKFGTVNALLGGVLHAAVDGTTGNAYYVYGNRDSVTGNNRLSIIRLTDNGAGGLTIGTPHFVTGQVQSALPSVAVTSNGTVGVLYDTFDGMSGGLPQFTAHFALSTDNGVTFTDNTLLTFLSSAADDVSDPRQRVLGDYQQVKAVGTTFYGVFTANGAPLGRPIANHDPIFFKLEVGCTSITCPPNKTQSNDPGQCGANVAYANATPNGSCGTITCSPASGSFFPVGTTTVTCTSSTGPTCTFTVKVNDTQPPSITCPANKTQSTDPGLCSAVVTYNNATATDNCPGVGTPVCSPASGSTFPKGITTVTCNVSDASSNPASCSFTITVNDTEKPTINCPPPVTAVTATVNDPCVVVNFTTTASDNCPGVTVVCNPPSGSCFPVGVTTVTCTATDASANTATCTFTVSVFNGRLQDDFEACNDSVLFNTLTGDYRWCCHGTIFASRGKITRAGDTIRLEHVASDRRVRIDLSAGAFPPSGNGSIQSPPGTVRCVLQDRDTRDDTCLCGAPAPPAPPKAGKTAK